MIGKGLASCPQCSPMAQGGLVVMAGMVALVIAQSDKGGHQGKGLALIYFASFFKFSFSGICRKNFADITAFVFHYF